MVRHSQVQEQIQKMPQLLVAVDSTAYTFCKPDEHHPKDLSRIQGEISLKLIEILSDAKSSSE